MSPATYLSTFAVLPLLLWQGIEGYPSGAPTSVCGSMTPTHGTAQTDSNPFSIDVGSVTSYTVGTKVTVTIQGGVYKGTLLQARRKNSANKEPVGTFNDPDASINLKLIQCSAAGDSITQANTNEKDGVSVMWNPPLEGVGEVEFVATVATGKTVWWLNTKSIGLTTGPINPVTQSTSPASVSNTVDGQANPEITIGGDRTTEKTTTIHRHTNTASCLRQHIGQILLFTVSTVIALL